MSEETFTHRSMMLWIQRRLECTKTTTLQKEISTESKAKKLQSPQSRTELEELKTERKAKAQQKEIQIPFSSASAEQVTGLVS